MGSFTKKSLEDEGSMKEKQAHRKTPVVKAIGLVLFIVTALLVLRGTGMQQHLTADYLATVLKTAGLWAPVAYVFIYAAGVCLFIPGTLLTAIAAAIFGPYLGFVVVWGGAMLGASLAFLNRKDLGKGFRRFSHRQPPQEIRRRYRTQRLCHRLVPAPRVFSLHAHELRHGAHEGAV